MIPADDDINHANIGSNTATIDGAVAWALNQKTWFSWRHHLEWFIARGYLIIEDGDCDTMASGNSSSSEDD